LNEMMRPSELDSEADAAPLSVLPAARAF